MIKKLRKGSNERLSENFTSSEFDCHCRRDDCIETYVSMDLVAGLQLIRYQLEVPVTVNSGFRCVSHNSDVGGAPRSFHTLGMAADVRADVLLEDLLDAAKRVDCFRDGGIGIYSDRLHLDVRGHAARWEETFRPSLLASS